MVDILIAVTILGLVLLLALVAAPFFLFLCPKPNTPTNTTEHTATPEPQASES
jgi:hypothetical protein